jgi:hypothetical protein
MDQQRESSRSFSANDTEFAFFLVRHKIPILKRPTTRNESIASFSCIGINNAISDCPCAFSNTVVLRPSQWFHHSQAEFSENGNEGYGIFYY